MSLTRYWGSKPIFLIKSLLREFRGEIVVDPFGGSGSIVKTVLEGGGRAIYIDINPVAWLHAHVFIAATSINEYSRVVDEILDRVENTESTKYGLKNDYLRYRNGRWFWKKRVFGKVSDFFPEENRVKLFKLLETIDKTDCSLETKLALYLTFCSTLNKSSLMNRESGGSWPVPCYWIPIRNKPIDPYIAFKNTTERFMKYFSKTRRYKVVYRLKDLDKGDAALILGNAMTFKYNNDWSLFTDPPFLDEIQYMELSYFYWVWLRGSKFPEILAKLLGRKIRYCFSSELVVNPRRNLFEEDYFEKMSIFAQKVKNLKEKILIFHSENKQNVEKILSILKKYWRNIEVENITINNQRNIGPRGTKNYVIIRSQ